MEYKNDYPTNYPADSADEHGDYVDGDVVREDEVRQEEQDHPKDRVDDEYWQPIRTSS